MNTVLWAVSGYCACAGSGHGSAAAHGSGLIVGANAWLQRKVHLRPQHRGVHLVTEEILRGVSIAIFFAVLWYIWGMISKKR